MRSFLARMVYTGLTGAVVWSALVPFALWQIARRRASLRDLKERLGRSTADRDRPGPQLLVHAVSAGEAMAAGAFVEALSLAQPDWRVTLTCGTGDGRAMADLLKKGLGCIESVGYLPWDRQAAILSWLSAMRPDAVVVVEPEIWPNLYLACDRLGIPLMLINAHVYPRDVARYRLVRRFMGEVLRVPRWIAAQSEADRAALVAIGAPSDKVVVLGSLKFDAATCTRGVAKPPLPGADSSGLVIVGGSTHDPEEEWLLDAFEQLRSRFSGLRLILAPRHPQRASAIESAARARGCCVARMTDASAPSGWDVLVADRFGDLSSLYAAADVAVVGGSFAERGGHNVLEPASRGRAIVVGPHVDHVRGLVDSLDADGGLIRLSEATPTALVNALAGLLGDEAARRELGERARRHHLAGSGAARRCVERVIAEVQPNA